MPLDTLFSANNMPNIQGVQRRLRAYEHISKFVENESEVNESQHIYLANTDKIRISKLNSKLAFFDIK